MSELNGKTVLVTGGTGFLGSALIRQLAHDGAKIRTIVRRPERNRLIKDTPNVEILAGDLANPESLATALENCDIVFHVAVSYGDLEEQMQVNVEGTRHLVQMALKAGVKRFVHVSSLAAYGYYVRGIVNEDTALRPSIEPYSTTKALAEKMVIDHSSHPMSYSIVRPGGIYGANSGMWTHTMFSIARNVPLLFIGNGSGHIPLIHVDDLVDLITLCAIHPNAHNQIFNAVYAKPYTWREFIGEYAKLVNNRSWWSIPVPLVRFTLRTLGGLAFKDEKRIFVPELLEYALSDVIYSTQKAKNLLGWQTQIDLQEGIKKCIPYLREKGLLK